MARRPGPSGYFHQLCTHQWSVWHSFPLGWRWVTWIRPEAFVECTTVPHVGHVCEFARPATRPLATWSFQPQSCCLSNIYFPYYWISIYFKSYRISIHTFYVLMRRRQTLCFQEGIIFQAGLSQKSCLPKLRHWLIDYRHIIEFCVYHIWPWTYSLSLHILSSRQLTAIIGKWWIFQYGFPKLDCLFIIPLPMSDKSKSQRYWLC